MALAFAILLVAGGVIYLIGKGFTSGYIPAITNAVVGNYDKESMYEANRGQRLQKIASELELGTGKSDHVFEFLGGIATGRHAAEIIGCYVVWLGGYISDDRLSNFGENTIEGRKKLINQINEFSRNRKPLTQERRDEIWFALGHVDQFKKNGCKFVDTSTKQGKLFYNLVEMYPDKVAECIESGVSRDYFVQVILREEFLCPAIPIEIKNLLHPFSSYDRAAKEYLVFEGYDVDTQLKIMSLSKSVIPNYIKNGYRVNLDGLNERNSDDFFSIYPAYRDILDTLTEPIDAEVLAAKILGRKGNKFRPSNSKANKEPEVFEFIRNFRKRHREYILAHEGNDWLHDGNHCYKWTMYGNEMLQEMKDEKGSEASKKRNRNGIIGWVSGWIAVLLCVIPISLPHRDIEKLANSLGVQEEFVAVLCIILIAIFVGLWIYFYWIKYRREKDNDLEFEWAKNLW